MRKTTMYHNDNQEIQMRTNAVSRGDEVLEKTTLVGDDKIAMDYEYDHGVIIRYTRKTEKGIITRNKKLPIAMVFQDNPIWLLALEPNYVE